MSNDPRTMGMNIWPQMRDALQEIARNTRREKPTDLEMGYSIAAGVCGQISRELEIALDDPDPQSKAYSLRNLQNRVAQMSAKYNQMATEEASRRQGEAG